MHRHAVASLRLALGLLVTGVWTSATGQAAPLVRLEAGALNPDDVFQATLGYGATVGVTFPPYDTIFLRVLRQSANGNSGADLTSDARTFWLVGYEREGTPADRFKQQLAGRVVIGRLERNQFQTAWVVGLGFVQRIRLFRRLAVVGSIEDLVAFLPRETYTYCRPFLPCEPVELRRNVQHNFGLVVAFEFRGGAASPPPTGHEARW